MKTAVRRAIGATVLALALPILVAVPYAGELAASAVPAIPDGATTPARTEGAVPAEGAGAGPLRRVHGPRVVAVGDIACRAEEPVTARTCLQASTARQARSVEPYRVLALGDLQYETGSEADFLASYDRSWGSLKPITRPIPGNHEYLTPGAAGYYSYFAGQQPGPPGYYAFDVGKWRVYALNSNCTLVDCTTEAEWLDRDMTQHPRACSLIMLHHPLYSSGREHGGSTEGQRFWEIAVQHGAEVALAGHDHDYERFRRLDANGVPTRRGLVSFVVGTGGRNLKAMGTAHPHSAAFDSHDAGVLLLKLGPQRYAWRYRSLDGKFVDRGLRSCG